MCVCKGGREWRRRGGVVEAEGGGGDGWRSKGGRGEEDGIREGGEEKGVVVVRVWEEREEDWVGGGRGGVSDVGVWVVVCVCGGGVPKTTREEALMPD